MKWDLMITRSFGILHTYENKAFKTKATWICVADSIAPLAYYRLILIRYNLPFERFLNCERYTMPDIDLDSQMISVREDILAYIVSKYGNQM